MTRKAKVVTSVPTERCPYKLQNVIPIPEVKLYSKIFSQNMKALYSVRIKVHNENQIFLIINSDYKVFSQNFNLVFIYLLT